MTAMDDFLAEYGRAEGELLDGEQEIVQIAEDAYGTDRHGVFRIRREDCALIVVDMQEDLVNPAGAMCVPEAYRQVPRIKRMVEQARRLAVPVFYTEVTIPDDAPHQYRDFFPPLAEGAVGEGEEGMRVYHELKPEAGERVISTKFGFDAFNGTPLDYILRQRGVRTVIICGTLTNFCCETTARSAYGLGYQVVFGSDVNATDNAEAQRATLRTMRRGFGRVLDHQGIMRALDGNDETFEAATAGDQ